MNAERATFAKRFPVGAEWPREGEAAHLAKWLGPGYGAFRADVECLREVTVAFSRERSANSDAMDHSVKTGIP